MKKRLGFYTKPFFLYLSVLRGLSFLFSNPSNFHGRKRKRLLVSVYVIEIRRLAFAAIVDNGIFPAGGIIIALRQGIAGIANVQILMAYVAHRFIQKSCIFSCIFAVFDGFFLQKAKVVPLFLPKTRNGRRYAAVQGRGAAKTKKHFYVGMVGNAASHSLRRCLSPENALFCENTCIYLFSVLY